ALQSCGWSLAGTSPSEEAVKWRAKLREIQTYRVIGDVLVCRIEGYREIHGCLPSALADIGDPLQTRGTWKYHTTEPAKESALHRGVRRMFGVDSPRPQTYELRLRPDSQDDAELVWRSEEHLWWWQSPNEMRLV